MSLVSFIAEVEYIISKHGVDTIYNTPDYVLARYMLDCLRAYQRAKKEVDEKVTTKVPLVVELIDEDCVKDIR